MSCQGSTNSTRTVWLYQNESIIIHMVVVGGKKTSSKQWKKCMTGGSRMLREWCIGSVNPEHGFILLMQMVFLLLSQIFNRLRLKPPKTHYKLMDRCLQVFLLFCAHGQYSHLVGVSSVLGLKGQLIIRQKAPTEEHVVVIIYMFLHQQLHDYIILDVQYWCGPTI